MSLVQDQLDYMYGLQRFGLAPGLERMKRIMDLAGHPERKFKAIHISGTNGKGSVAAMLDSVLLSSDEGFSGERLRRRRGHGFPPEPTGEGGKSGAEEQAKPRSLGGASGLERENSRRIGLYTSPHLYRFNERIRVNGEDISDEDLVRLAEHVRTMIEADGLRVTFF